MLAYDFWSLMMDQRLWITAGVFIGMLAMVWIVRALGKTVIIIFASIFLAGVVFKEVLLGPMEWFGSFFDTTKVNKLEEE